MYQHPEFISQYAKSQRFSVGRPRNFTISKLQDQIFFLQANSITDPTLCLFSLNLKTKEFEQLINPHELIDLKGGGLPDAEKARRERLREAGVGIVAYHLNESGEKITFTLAGNLYLLDVVTKSVKQFSKFQGVVDPKISPNGKYLGFVVNNSLQVIEVASENLIKEFTDDSEQITYGLANFIAAEEFSRITGFWWSKDSENLLIEKVDSTKVSKVHLMDPADPSQVPRAHNYPFAGGNNPRSSLVLFNIGGTTQDLSLMTQDYEYLVNAGFKNNEEIFVNLLNRAQDTLVVKIFNLKSNSTQIFFTEQQSPWVEVIQPLPKFFDDDFVYLTGEELQVISSNGLEVPNQNFQVQSVLNFENGEITALVSPTPPNLALVKISKNGEISWLSDPNKYSSGLIQGGVNILVKHNLSVWQPEYLIETEIESIEISNTAISPNFAPNISLEYLPQSNLYAAVVAPNNYQGERLPVIMSPYSGPHAQRVLNTSASYLSEQFLAEQGYLVVVIDGRGTPGRGKEFAQSISEHWAQKVLSDQINGLNELSLMQKWNFDLSKVGIKGWSFGGYLAAYAVLMRSDFFAAAIAGAPVTDWRWYDTAYSERYLGSPETNADLYEENSLINKVDSLESPLLLIHGLADDNVLAMHSLRLSQALFEKSKAHNFISLSQVTHMTQGASTVESLLKLEIDFFNKNLKD